MKYLYGNFSENQITDTTQLMHSEVHKLLLYKDSNIDSVIFADDEQFITFFKNLMYRFGGMNELLGEPSEMVLLMSTLQAALTLVTSDNYSWRRYRQLILDSHGYISSMFNKEV